MNKVINLNQRAKYNILNHKNFFIGDDIAKNTILVVKIGRTPNIPIAAAKWREIFGSLGNL